MDKLCQLYDEQGLPIGGKGSKKDDVFSQGLLHGAAHVWIWRRSDKEPEVLLQKRASHKRTWPDRYDISAAGHIDLGEEPLDAALRETKEEINLKIAKDELKLFTVFRVHLRAENNAIENEFQWLYSLELLYTVDFNLQVKEVASLIWVPINQFLAECTSNKYVPHGELYYRIVADTIKSAAEAV